MAGLPQFGEIWESYISPPGDLGGYTELLESFGYNDQRLSGEPFYAIDFVDLEDSDSLLSEAVRVSNSGLENEFSPATTAAAGASLPLEIPLEMAEIKLELDEPTPDMEWTCDEVGPAFDMTEVKSDSEITVPILFKDFAQQQQQTQKKKRSRKQQLHRTPVKFFGELPVLPKQVNEVTTTSRTAPNTPQKPRKSRTQRQPAKKTEKAYLYLKKKTDCANAQEWNKVKRARNTKQFHERHKKKLQTSMDVLVALLQEPECLQALQRLNLLRKVQEVIPEVLPETSVTAAACHY